MAVTLPFVLLLLDFWPLRRLSRRALVEKLPLIAMAAGAGALTFFAQRKAAELGSVTALEDLPFSVRAAHATASYSGYLAKTVWPAGLAAFYPAHALSLADVLGAATILLALTVAAVKWVRHCPGLLIGWLWYLGMLAPVIGIVQQVGDQNFADRYDYLPMVGLSIAAIWTVGDVIAKRPAMLRGAAVFSVVWAAALAVAAARQTAYWADSRALFEHGLAVTDGNYFLANNLGVVLESKNGPSAQSAALFRQAIAFNPNHAPAHVNLGLDLMRSGRMEEGRAHLIEAVRLNPKLAMAQAALGVMFAGEGNYEEARRSLEESLRLDPEQAEAQNNMCAVLLHSGRAEEAAAHCAEALQAKPAYPMARINFARAFALENKKGEAERELKLALEEDPTNPTARQALIDLRNGQLR
jgi:protein O-mannosyl-transferase